MSETVTRTDTNEAQTIRGGADPYQFFVKVPRYIVEGLAAGRVDLHEIELALVTGHILRHAHCYDGASPTMRELRELCGISDRKLKGIIARAVERGLVTARKRSFEYAPGQFAAKWVFQLVDGSPVDQLRGDAAALARPWVPVPCYVSRMSPISVAAYLLLREQADVDRAIVTTPGDLAKLLKCSRSWAHEIVTALGATRLEFSGVRVWALPDAQRDRNATGSVTFHSREFRAPADARAWKLQARLAEADKVLKRAHVDVETQLRSIEQACQANGIEPTAAFILRCIEVANARTLAVQSDPTARWMRARIGNRLTSRARSLAHEVELRVRRKQRALQHEALHFAAQTLCIDCEGTGLVLATEHDGTETYRFCGTCTT